MLLASRSCRLGMLLNILQQDNLPQQTIIRPKLPKVLRLKDPAVCFKIKEMIYFLPGSWHSRDGISPSILPCTLDKK